MEGFVIGQFGEEKEHYIAKVVSFKFAVTIWFVPKEEYCAATAYV